MTGFYRNMATGDYDEYRDTENVQKPSKEEKKTFTQRRFTSDDLRPVDEDDDY